MTGEVTIRPASAADGPAIQALHARCVPDLFAGLLGDWVPPDEERGEIERSWTGPFGAPLPRHAFLVAECGERLVGFTAVGPTRDDGGDPGHTGELRVVIVDPGQRGAGIGAALIAAGERAMRAIGLSAATLWVVPENARALRCYERCGWRADGAERIGEYGGRAIRSIRYRKRLVPPHADA